MFPLLHWVHNLTSPPLNLPTDNVAHAKLANQQFLKHTLYSTLYIRSKFNSLLQFPFCSKQRSLFLFTGCHNILVAVDLCRISNQEVWGWESPRPCLTSQFPILRPINNPPTPPLPLSLSWQCTVQCTLTLLTPLMPRLGISSPNDSYYECSFPTKATAFLMILNFWTLALEADDIKPCQIHIS